ncbi:MAG TPA: biotin/lipoyl-containing protein, partial [Rhodocyclaceae bacterium]|nr:biotin/lipoyl-containing protein [Rhodocyclaceae bacterium]
PAESLSVRVDTGVEEGDEITPHYDPMIAKLIVHGETRERACALMLQALAQYRVVGVANNVDFLSRLVACPAFAQADLDTGLIERQQDFLFGRNADIPREAWLAAALAELLREQTAADEAARRDADPHSPWHLRDGWRVNIGVPRRLTFRAGDETRTIGVSYVGNAYRLEIDGHATQASGEMLPGSQLRADFGGNRAAAAVVVAGEKRHVFLHGHCFVLAAVDPLFHAGEGGGAEGGLTAPMPGKVIGLGVAVGARVDKGAPLMILEAMKMEHTICAPAAGTVRAFRYGVGEQVADGAELVDFEPLK